MDLALLQKREQKKRSTAQIKDFTSALDLINEEQWKKNQTVAHERRARDNRFNEIATRRRSYLKSASTNSIRDNILTSIDDFDRRLEADAYRDDSDFKRTVGGAIKKLTVEDPGAKFVDATFLDKNVLQSSMTLERKSIKERNEDKRVKESSNDRRRRRFLGEREINHKASLMQAAASEIIDQLLNPSQSEIFEAQYLRRVQLQRDLIAENRLNRDHLISSLNTAEICRSDIWRKEQVAREIEWVVDLRIAAQLDKFKTLEEAQNAAEREVRLLASNMVLTRLRELSIWIDSCDTFGLFPSLGSIPLEFLLPTPEVASAAQESCDTSLSPSIFWSDAKIMFNSPLAISKPMSRTILMKVFGDLPYSLSEQLSLVDAQRLLSKPLKSHDCMPSPLQLQSFNCAVDDELQLRSISLEDMDSRLISFGDKEAERADLAVMTECSIDNTLLSTDMNASTCKEKSKELWDTDPVRKISEYLAEYDRSTYVNNIGNAEIVITESNRLPLLPLPIVHDIAPLQISTSRGGKGPVTPVETEEVPVHPALLVQTPSWLYTTPSKHLLGEIIVDIRCAADDAALTPTQLMGQDGKEGTEDFNPSASKFSVTAITPGEEDVTVSKGPEGDVSMAAGSVCALLGNSTAAVKSTIFPFSVRLALCGPSELAKKAVSNAVSEASNGRVRVIRVEKLLNQAIELATQLVASGVPTTVKAIESTEGVDSARPVEDSREYDRQQLAILIHSIMLAGEVLPDDVYVSLVVLAIRHLSYEGCEPSADQGVGGELDSVQAPIGFLLEDFPNTKQQASLLVTALSGIDYDSHMPQAADKASPYAVLAPCELSVHDISLCGLDSVLFLESAAPNALESVLSEISSARVNIDTDQVVYLKAGYNTEVPPSDLSTASVTNTAIESLENLWELQGMHSSRHTTALDIAITSNGAPELKKFLGKIGVLKEADPSSFNSLSEFATAAAGILYKSAGGDSSRASAGGSRVDFKAIAVDAPGTAAAEEEVKMKKRSAFLLAPLNCEYIEGFSEGLQSPQSRPSVVYSKVSPELARSLAGMWGAVESQSVDVGRAFFKGLRDSRYQMMQRRRMLHDTLSVLQSRVDGRQELFDDFVTTFNQVDDDFRFDMDCVAELHLRSLELREALLVGCDARKKEADLFVARAAIDGVCSLLIHQNECEGAAMLQAEFNRFIVSLHLLFDYTKYMATYDSTRKAVNVLEETLQAGTTDETPSLANFKSDGRKLFTSTSSAPLMARKQTATLHRKGSAISMSLEPEPYRAPIPPISLPLGIMGEIPRQGTPVDSVEEDLKAVTTRSVKVKSDVRVDNQRKDFDLSLNYYLIKCLFLLICMISLPSLSSLVLTLILTSYLSYRPCNAG